MNKNLKKKEFVKGKKGITLIALVITIIVLLILAGISIIMLSGDNSILRRAGDAREKILRQLTTAVSDGALAATYAIKEME